MVREERIFDTDVTEQTNDTLHETYATHSGKNAPKAHRRLTRDGDDTYSWRYARGGTIVEDGVSFPSTPHATRSKRRAPGRRR